MHGPKLGAPLYLLSLPPSHDYMPRQTTSASGCQKSSRQLFLLSFSMILECRIRIWHYSKKFLVRFETFAKNSEMFAVFLFFRFQLQKCCSEKITLTFFKVCNLSVKVALQARQIARDDTSKIGLIFQKNKYYVLAQILSHILGTKLIIRGKWLRKKLQQIH